MREENSKKFKVSVVKALLPHMILTAVQQKPIHGYALISQIRKRFGVYLGASTVYPALNSLEEQGLIQSEWNMLNDRPRKVYTLTTKGSLLLNQTTQALTFINRTIEVKA